MPVFSVFFLPEGRTKLRVQEFVGAAASGKESSKFFIALQFSRYASFFLTWLLIHTGGPALFFCKEECVETNFTLPVTRDHHVWKVWNKISTYTTWPALSTSTSSQFLRSPCNAWMFCQWAKLKSLQHLKLPASAFEKICITKLFKRFYILFLQLDWSNITNQSKVGSCS